LGKQKIKFKVRPNEEEKRKLKAEIKDGVKRRTEQPKQTPEKNINTHGIATKDKYLCEILNHRRPRQYSKGNTV
jgi:hypothetical protein